MRLIDVHCHVNFSAYKDDAEDVIRRSLEQGVGMFAVGSQSTTSKRAVEYADRHDGVWAVIGLHPIHLFEQEVDEVEAGGEDAHFRSRAEVFDAEFYRGLIKGSDKVVGIGECGLDYYHVPAGVDADEFRRRQEVAFRVQIDLALEFGLPIMIHSRNAADGSTDVHADIMEILAEYRDIGNPVKGDVHCFSGTVADMRKYVELGMHISFTGNLTYKPRKVDIEKGETLHDVARETPLDRLLVETDAPYLTPASHRGERNEPAFAIHVADKIAELKGIEPEEVYSQTLENTKRLFAI
ncbi:MAG: TatD family hydrolase [Patescibacteria group bacterium]|nr:TatD family hydrolase [Patescibacteria group bacterium]